MTAPSNVWLPARDQATAERLYRVSPMYAQPANLSLLSFINKGWTLAALLEHRYAEAIPAQPAWPGAPVGSLPGSLPQPAPGVETPASSPRTSVLLEQYGNASDIAASVVDQVLSRDAYGQRKYGVSLDRIDLDTPDWLQHMAEELLDGAHYALAAKREITRRGAAQRDAVVKSMNTAQDQARALMSDAEYKVAERALGVFWRLYQSEVPE